MSSAAATATDADSGLTPEQADAETLAEIYLQGVDTATASPGIGEYLRDTLIYSLSRVLDRLSDMSGLFSDLHWGWLREFLTLALFVLVAVMLVLLVRRILRRRRLDAGDGRVSVEPPRRPVSAARDWAAELRRCLEVGDVAGALAALWWWLAMAVGLPDADPAWTSRELLLHAGRADLRRPVRRLDHLLYGPVPPAGHEVEQLWQVLRTSIAERDPGSGGDG